MLDAPAGAQQLGVGVHLGAHGWRERPERGPVQVPGFAVERRQKCVQIGHRHILARRADRQHAGVPREPVQPPNRRSRVA